MGEEAVIDLFAGPGGWDWAARAFGIAPLGVEFDDAACATRAAAGLRTLQADVAALDPRKVLVDGFGSGDLWGLIASPPCQAFSMAGKGAGRRAMAAYERAIHNLAVSGAYDVEALDRESADPRGHLVLEPLRWALALKPRWVACEQVEPVLPLWEATAAALRGHGYQTWTGVLSSECFGVPQTRRRAFLLASLDGPVRAPRPTHQRYVPPRRREEATLGLFDAPEPERIVLPEDRELLPWVSMAVALGWGMTARPYPVIAGGTGGGPDLEKVGGSAAREAIYGEQAAGRWAGSFVATGEPTKNGNHADGEWQPDVRFRAANDRPNAAERELDAPALSLAFGHNAPDTSSRVMVNTGRDWKPGGSREDAQTFDAGERPAPAVDGKGRWHVEYRRGGERLEESTPDRWQIKPDVEWTGERPATTLAGDPRVFPPGHKINADDIAAGRGGQQRSGAGWTESRPAPTVVGGQRSKDGAIIGRQLPAGEDESVGGWSDVEGAPRNSGQAVRVSLAEALVLQSFPPDYPVAGTKTKQFEQVGNAVPPFLAWAVLRAVLS